MVITLSRRRFRANFHHHTAAQISASTRRRRFRPAHGGADFGQHTAAQISAKISAITRRRRISASTRRHRCSSKNSARKKFAGRRSANFFRDRYGRTGFYDRKGFFIKSTSCEMYYEVPLMLKVQKNIGLVVTSVYHTNVLQ